MMDDLVTWLRAVLDEDERVAAGSGNLGWLTFRQADGTIDHTEAASLDDDGTAIVAGRHRTGYASAVIVYRETRVLREVEAKRRIITEHEPVNDRDVCPVCWSEIELGEPAPSPCPTLRLLALPYADRPGYRDEWRPA